MTQACWKDTRCGFIWCYDQNQPDFEILNLIRKCPKLKNGRTQPKGSFQSVRLYSKAGSLWDKTPWNQPEQKWRIKILILVLAWKLTALFFTKNMNDSALQIGVQSPIWPRKHPPVFQVDQLTSRSLFWGDRCSFQTNRTLSLRP